MDLPTSGPFIDYLGVEMTEATGERVLATWTVGEHLHQPYGIVHGGAHAAVVETLASIGAGLWWAERGQVVGVNNSTDFYRAVREGDLTCTALPIHQGRSQQVWVVEIRDDRERLVARGQVRLQNLSG